jgi:GNAT superfamily N-acetyltransferase
MRLTTFTRASDLLDAVRPTLAEHEAEHHLVLGVAESLVVSPLPDGEFLGVSVDDDHGLVMAALATRRRPLLIASDRARGDVAAAARLMWDAIDAAGLSPSHVIGGLDQAPSIADAWMDRGSRTARVAMHQRVYKLTSVEPLGLASGSLRQATVADTSLVLDWVAAFEREALTAIVPQSPRAVVERRIAAGELFLWCDPEPRTMAGWARPTRHAVAVNGVYTPTAWRGRGYATACVATLSARMLEHGFEFCVLYPDLGNPTSNAIYTRIGYRPVRDFLMYALG